MCLILALFDGLRKKRTEAYVGWERDGGRKVKGKKGGGLRMKDGEGDRDEGGGRKRRRRGG